MDTIASIATAVALGAAAGLQETTAQVVRDGYNALKTLLTARFPQIRTGIDQLEQAPESAARRAVVTEDLRKACAGNDSDVLQQARALLDLIERHAPRAAAAVGVELEDVRAASLTIHDVLASGTGVKGKKLDVEGDITIKKVRAGQSPAKE